MKYSKISATILFVMAIFLIACNNNSKVAPKKTITPTPVPTLEPPQNARGVWHYTCIKGCVGGSGSAGNCTTCGNTLAHNSAYHSNSAPSSAPFANAPFATPPAAPSGKNSNGIWHYTCARGCAGGSGSAGNCGNCGDALAHNTAYHN
jgi:hypothetical protein